MGERGGVQFTCSILGNIALELTSMMLHDEFLLLDDSVSLALLTVDSAEHLRSLIAYVVKATVKRL